jgi:hypothetical protein
MTSDFWEFSKVFGEGAFQDSQNLYLSFADFSDVTSPQQLFVALIVKNLQNGFIESSQGLISIGGLEKLEFNNARGKTVQLTYTRDEIRFKESSNLVNIIKLKIEILGQTLENLNINLL